MVASIDFEELEDLLNVNLLDQIHTTLQEYGVTSYDINDEVFEKLTQLIEELIENVENTADSEDPDEMWVDSDEL